MSDDNKPKLGTRAPLGLNKAVAVGQVKQTFSHGRSKQVVVEVKRARVLHRPGEAAPEPTPAPAPAPMAASSSSGSSSSSPPARPSSPSPTATKFPSTATGT